MSTLEPAAQSKPPGGFKLWLSQLQMKHGRKLVIALPYIWLILLFLLPFIGSALAKIQGIAAVMQAKEGDQRD